MTAVVWYSSLYSGYTRENVTSQLESQQDAKAMSAIAPQKNGGMSKIINAKSVRSNCSVHG